MKIVVTQELGLYEDQVARLEKLGEVKIYKDLAESPEAWLERVRGFDVICSGKLGLKQKYQELRDVMVSVPFVGVGWLDKDILKRNNITVSNAPGCNKDAVSEWVVGMMINLVRELPTYINTDDDQLSDSWLRKQFRGLYGMNLCVLGAGNIGKRVGKVCEALDMNVSYFKRGDDLLACVRDSDVIVNALGSNHETRGLLGEAFFDSLKQGSYFISIADQEIFDQDALFKALDSGRMAGAAIDCGSIQVGTSDNPDYLLMQKHPKVLATPHIAYNTDRTDRLGNDMMIGNIEAWLQKKPINLI